jgi:hypothetical protein
MPQPLYPQGKSPWYTMERRLCGTQDQPGCFAGDKILGPTKTQTLIPVSSSLQSVLIPTASPQPQIKKKKNCTVSELFTAQINVISKDEQSRKSTYEIK